MLKNAIPASRRCVISFLAMVMPLSVSAQNLQEKESATKAASEAKLSTDVVKTGLYVISGGGGNTLFRFSANGLILVDGKLPGNYRALMSQVRNLNKLSDLPVRALIVTEHHDTHSGNNAQFLAAGVAIIAQENTKNRLPAYPPPPDGKALTPVVGYDRDYTFHLGGVEVQLEHFGNARTDGDTVVYFAGQKAVAVGDLYTPGTPDPDFSAGGSLVNWGPVLADVLKLDFDTVVPSDGPPVSRAALEAFKGKVDTAVSRASALVKKGVPKDQLMAQLKTDDLGWRFDFSGPQLDAFYAELSQMQ
jgi:glyoxylase-like metal-dependent hydrolase (beta-lactamase superfamily II)